MDVRMRASDDDRQRVIDLLQRHTTAGRLTLDEFSQRVGDVYSARTMGDLAALTGDLPAEATQPSGQDAIVEGRRELLVLFAVAGAALVLLFLLMALRH